MSANFPNLRLRRLRGHQGLRALVQETRLQVKQLVQPLFICPGKGIEKPILSMPDCCQQSLDTLAKTLDSLDACGINTVLLFGIPTHKDAQGSEALHSQGIIPRAVEFIRAYAPHFIIMTDVCFCEYTDHGHCGVLQTTSEGNQEVANDLTLNNLVTQAVIHAQAGAHVVAPSGMMDGMIGAIRQGLDTAGFSQVVILSYAVKYASALYGPFREASEVKLSFGDRRTYQMDPANSLEALREVALDIQEGADMIMVKPAGWYLDIIHQLKTTYPEVPLVAYQVSGEYAMLKAVAAQGWLDEEAIMLESLLAMVRAGARILITYYAKKVATVLAATT